MPDLVIIGGGIVGSSAAYQAVGAGADVVLVDAGHPGRATDAGAGIVSPVGLDRTEPAWTGLIAEAVAYYHRLLAELDHQGPWPGPPIFRVVGQIVLADGDAELAWLSEIEARVASAESRRRLGLTGPTSRLAGSELREHWPELRSDLSGLFIPDVGRVNGRQLAQRLRTAAERRVAQGTGRLAMITGEAVVQSGGSGITVRVGAELIKAGAALLAAGAWLGADPAALGIGPMIKPDKGQIVHLSVPGAGTTTRPVLNTRSAGYFLGFDDRVVVGATHEDAGFSATVTAGGQLTVLSRALGFAPGLAAAPLIETRAGLRPVSQDGMPLVGPTALPGVWLANGLAAWGLTLGPLLGGVAARQALGDPVDDRFRFLDPTRRPSG
ncbi:NAD(P)/FAD-dependent oxidoreductase [Microlunatus speluncae]|uniref:NAD(P)/FAD-dependent oxidoreductase n=1 Tax=Microlunatus speluncae TaxID=2594267 RepID=UPI001375EE0F|nr:FAD-dependent oxidoreductase [Microlunatus speluncae]